MEDILAIDFGTTNSTACAFSNNKRVQIWNNDKTGEYLFPSFVDYSDKGVTVGYPAKLFMGRPGHFVVSCVKRLIGQTYDDYLKLDKKDIFGCDVVRGDDGYPFFIVNKDGTKKVSCIDVACELFKRIKESAEKICERTFSKAYVTRPANFNDKQVKAIREAARRAGLIVDKMITEPTAAGLSWCKTAVKGLFPKLKVNTNVLVIDFGGGTLDFSVIRYIGNGQFKVEDNSGNPCLGGNDIDNVLMDLVLKKLKTDYNIEINKSEKRMPQKLARLRNFCEGVKIEVNSKAKDDDFYTGFLTKNEKLTYEIDVSYITDIVDSIVLTFEEVTEAFMKCLEAAVKPLDYITSKPSQMVGVLKHVLLVGGSSQLMAFRQLLYQQGFNRKQFKKIDCMNCISQGAYELALMLNDPKREVNMNKQIINSYGLKSGSDKVEIILKKGATIPCSSAEVMWINCDNYTKAVRIFVYQCADDEDQLLVDISKCHLVDIIQFDVPKEYERSQGQPQLTVQFKIYVVGTLQVICKDYVNNIVMLETEINTEF